MNGAQSLGLITVSLLFRYPTQNFSAYGHQISGLLLELFSDESGQRFSEYSITPLRSHPSCEDTTHIPPPFPEYSDFTAS